MKPVNERSYEAISAEVLNRLAIIALQDLEDLYRRKPRWKLLYGDRLLCIALCQGAAAHYLDGTTGIKDWDVWSFFATNPTAPFPVRRRSEAALGIDRYGTTIDCPKLPGRRVDLLGRAIPHSTSSSPVESLTKYLGARRTVTAQRLSESPVVLLHPPPLMGLVAWPVGESLPITSGDAP